MVKKLGPTYKTADGYAFEAVNYDDWTKLLRITSEAGSYEEIISELREKNIPFCVYKEVDVIQTTTTEELH